MSIDYSGDFKDMLVECDFCVPSEELDLEGDWQECMDELKQLGWKNFKDASRLGEWSQKCPACVKGPTATEDFK